MLLQHLVTSSLFTYRCFGNIFVYATRDRPRHVLNLSAVCRLWREVALSSPMLWSTLELGHHTTRQPWIQRARSYPLSLVVRKQEGFLDPVDNVLALIANHQWKSITLDSGDKSILSILKELEFSNLESFSLTTRFFPKYPSQMPCDSSRLKNDLMTVTLNHL
jgi:hypothetical protein